MTAFLGRVLCALVNIHAWGPLNDPDSIWAQRRCSRCGALTDTSSYL